MCDVGTRKPLGRIFISLSRCIYHNLSFEEHLFRKHNLETDGDVLLLWRNRPTVVIGRHQNPWMEANLPFIKRNGIDLARRHSGGGAVYHDEGNVNISLLTSQRDHCRPRHLAFLADALNKTFQLQIVPNSRDDMELQPGSRKCSGTAARISHGRAYHHLTLLVNSDLLALKTALKSPWKSQFETNATRSKPAFAVGCLKQDDGSVDVDAVKDTIGKAFIDRYDICQVETVNPEDAAQNDRIHEGVKELRDWSWIFGKTPKFRFTSEDVSVAVERGVVTQVDGLSTLNLGSRFCLS